jgi:hypothetical protein
MPTWRINAPLTTNCVTEFATCSARTQKPAVFLHFPAGPSTHITVDAPIGERPGMMIGPYKLLEQIGEGGFGVVFMAKQTEPMRRKVALKVIKPGWTPGR